MLPYDAVPYNILEIWSTLIIAEQGEQHIARNVSFFKPAVQAQPVPESHDNEEDDITLPPTH